MIKDPPTEHRVALAGIVSDAGTGKPLVAVDIRITEMPADFQRKVASSLLKYGKQADLVLGRWDRTQTRSDGLFYFVDLPAGGYKITLSLPRSAGRYGSAHRSVTLSLDADGNVKREFLKLTLQPTTLKGKIAGPGRESGIVMAEVRIKGDGERKFSDAQGEYVLPCLQPGRHTVLVRAQGYQLMEQSATLASAGAVERLDFALNKDSALTGFAQGGASKRESARRKDSDELANG
ncbi:MAG: carboxypeptidase regulatory-like domain-containing protein [Bryobacteraceae bacterium]